jgi:hypothetical protein
MYGDCFAVQREHRLEQSVVSIKSNKYTPTDVKNLLGLIFVFCNTIIVMDRRGRRSLQGEIKLPYENLPFLVLFVIPQLSVCPNTQSDRQ